MKVAKHVPVPWTRNTMPPALFFKPCGQVTAAAIVSIETENGGSVHVARRLGRAVATPIAEANRTEALKNIAGARNRKALQLHQFYPGAPSISRERYISHDGQDHLIGQLSSASTRCHILYFLDQTGRV